eukprot:scaffold40494_cov20-Tisochrysis_lutea.AAC.1
MPLHCAMHPSQPPLTILSARPSDAHPFLLSGVRHPRVRRHRRPVVCKHLPAAHRGQHGRGGSAAHGGFLWLWGAQQG